MIKKLKLFQTDSEYTAFTGTTDFVKPNVSHCVQENHVHYNPHTFADEYFTTIARENGAITFNIWKTMGTDMITSISYSTDNGETWSTTNNTNNKSENLVITVNVNEGDKVMWKGNATQIGCLNGGEYGDAVGSCFLSTCEFDAQGNVMSLLYGDNYKNQTTIEKEGAFYKLFADYDEVKTCGIVNAKDLSLPATTLTNGCYSYMFASCTSLATTPELPATTLAQICYMGMFTNCTSLTTAPELPATTLAGSCYSYMFMDCTNLITAPELPATTLANYCYQGMFASCKSLTTAPKLSVTTLAIACYDSMFYDCTNLVNAPELPATTLAQNCYIKMFEKCTNLTTAPELPATTLVNYCYQEMFSGCTRLNNITCLATNKSATNCTNNWVAGVASSGTFTKAASISTSSWTRGTSGIPNGWTVQDAS